MGINFLCIYINMYRFKNELLCIYVDMYRCKYVYT